jgi:chloride channel 7
VPILGWDPPPLSHNVFAGDFMSYPVIKLNCIESVARIVDILKNENYNGFPVVTSVFRSDVSTNSSYKIRFVFNFNY